LPRESIRLAIRRSLLQNRPRMISLQRLTKRFGLQTAVNALTLDIPAG
jgi:hypothetical protein